MHFNVMEKFCGFFTLRPFDLNTILTYVLMDNFCPCFVLPRMITKRKLSIRFLRMVRLKSKIINLKSKMIG